MWREHRSAMILMVVLINANGREHRSAMILMVVLINDNAVSTGVL